MIREFQGEYRFLSNFYPAPIESKDALVAPTAEHAFQMCKSIFLKDQLAILNCPTPGQAKRAGRSITLRSDWEDIKVECMTRVVRAKFTQNPDLAERLLATGDQELQEGNGWKDRFWGVCPPGGSGLNRLGQILMQVRKELRDA